MVTAYKGKTIGDLSTYTEPPFLSDSTIPTLTMTSLVHTTVTQAVLQRDLVIPLRPSTTRAELASVALTMSELSSFEPGHLTLLSPSPSKEKNLAQERDSISFGCNPEKSIMTSLMELSKRIEELERQNQDHISERRNLNTRLEQQQQHHISEQRNLNAQLAILQPIIWRILTDAYLSIKGYRSSSGARSSWISTNIVRLLPPTGTTAAAFEQKLA
jgi:hypothetical protein